MTTKDLKPIILAGAILWPMATFAQKPIIAPKPQTVRVVEKKTTNASGSKVKTDKKRVGKDINKTVNKKPATNSASSTPTPPKQTPSSPKPKNTYKPPVLKWNEEEGEFTYGGHTYQMVYVEGGTFSMGDPSGDLDCRNVHSVTLSDYAIGQTEVPNWLWEAVMGYNPSFWKGEDMPVTQVSWYECFNFIDKLNTEFNLELWLPTEAQWEYAARGGNESRGYRYSGSSALGDVGAYINNTQHKGLPVAKFEPNELGIYDMSGNMFEWCWDWYQPLFYTNGDMTNPEGPGSGDRRIIRGGSWANVEECCRTAYRDSEEPVNAGIYISFRPVMN